MYNFYAIALIMGLGSSNYYIREDSMNELLTLRMPVCRLLIEEYYTTNDLEVKWRIKEICARRLKVQLFTEKEGFLVWEEYFETKDGISTLSEFHEYEEKDNFWNKSPFIPMSTSND